MGVSKTILEGKIKIGSDVSEAISGFKTLEKTLQKLDLGKGFNDKISNLFNKLTQSGEKMSDAIASGFKNKSDVTKYNTALQEMESALRGIKKEIQNIDSNKIHWSNPDIEKLEQQLSSLKNQAQELKNTFKNTNVFKEFQQLMSAPRAAKNSKSFFAAFESGDIEKMKAAASAIQSIADRTKQGTESNQFWTEAAKQANTVIDQYAKTMGTNLADQLDKTNQLTAEQTKELEAAALSWTKFTGDVNSASDALLKNGQNMQKTAEATSELNQSLDRFKQRATYFFGMENAVRLFRRAIRAAFNDVKELDKVMTQTAVVTNFSVGDLWSQLPEYTKRANALGVSIKSAYEAATLFYQQGLKTEQVVAVSTETLKMARIAGLDAATATDRMTNALRGFNMEINEANAQRINDVYSALAARTASDVNEISTAMTKVASLANNANMEFEKTSAFLAQIIETTRESAETAGTALKTVVARFSEVKDLYSKGQLLGTDEEGEEIHVNRVSKALATAGINLNEYLTGMKGLDDIFIELASKWDSLDEVQQRYIATMAAGSRQQSRFIAMMQNYKRTVELVDIAENAAGASTEQFNKTLDSMESKLEKLKNSWTTFTTSITDAGLIKFFVDFGRVIIDVVNNVTKLLGPLKGLGSSLALFGGLKLGKKIVLNMAADIGMALQGQADVAAKQFGTRFSTAFGKLKLAPSAVKGFFKSIDFSQSFKSYNTMLDSLSRSLAKCKKDTEQFTIVTDQLKNSRAALNTINASGLTYQEKAIFLQAMETDEDLRNTVATKTMSAAKLRELAAEKGINLEKGKGIGLRIKEKIATLGGANAEELSALVKKKGTVAQKGLNKAMLSGIATMAAYAALIAAIVFAIYAVTSAIQAEKNAIDGAKKAIEGNNEAITNLSEAYEDLSTRSKDLNNLYETQERLIEGSENWYKNLGSINKEIKELIDKYPQFEKFYYIDSNGNYKPRTSKEETDAAIQAELDRMSYEERLRRGSKDVGAEFNQMFADYWSVGNWFTRHVMGDPDVENEQRRIYFEHGRNAQNSASYLYSFDSDDVELARKIINANDYNSIVWNYLQNLKPGYKTTGNIYSTWDDNEKKNYEKFAKEVYGADAVVNGSGQITVNDKVQEGTWEVYANYKALQDAKRSLAFARRSAKNDTFLANVFNDTVTGQEIQRYIQFANEMEEFAKNRNGKSLTSEQISTGQLLHYFDENDPWFEVVTTLMSNLTSQYTQLLEYGFDESLLSNLNQPMIESLAKVSERITPEVRGNLARTMSIFMDQVDSQYRDAVIKAFDSTDLTSFSNINNLSDILSELLGPNAQLDSLIRTLKGLGIATMGFNYDISNLISTYHKTSEALQEKGNKIDEELYKDLQDVANIKGMIVPTADGYVYIGNDETLLDVLAKKQQTDLEDLLSSYFNYTTQYNQVKLGDSSRDQDHRELIEAESNMNQAYEVFAKNLEIAIASGDYKLLEHFMNSRIFSMAQSNNTIGTKVENAILSGIVSDPDFFGMSSDLSNVGYYSNLKENKSRMADITQLFDELEKQQHFLKSGEISNYGLVYASSASLMTAIFGEDYDANFINQQRELLLELMDDTSDYTDALLRFRQILAKDDKYNLFELLNQGTVNERGQISLDVGFGLPINPDEIHEIAAAYEELGYSVTETANELILIDTLDNYFKDLALKKGSGSGSDKDNGWKNPFDQLHNQLEAITAVQTKRNQLERQYNRLLKDEGATQTDVVNKLRERLDNLREEQALQRGLAEGRRKQLLDYAYSDKNAKYSQYIWEGQNGKIYIDWDAIDKAGHADPDEGKRIEEYVNEVKRLNDSYLEASDKADEITDSIEEVRQTIIDSYVNYQNMIKDALIHQEQKRIDMMSKINDSINDATDKLFDQAQKQIDEYRQTRENEKTESEIADKEARLAYLRRDTSGANALEIKKLEEELGDARQDYADSRIDQALEEMRNEADLAAEQRAEQIAIEQGILNYMDEIGAFWPEVEHLMAESVDENGKVITGSELEELLKKDGAFGSLSDVAKGQWSENYKSQVKENSKAALNNALYENSSDIKKVATVASTTEQEKTFNAMLDTTGNYANGMKSLHFDSDTTYQQAKDYYQRLGYGVWDRGNNTMMVTDLKALASSYGISYKFLDKIFQDGLITSNKGLKLTFPEDFSQISDASLYFEAQGYTTTNGKKYGEGRNILYLKGNGYSTGGLADFTGPAWLDGSRAHPEYVLNAAQTEGFLQLVDMFTKPQDAFSGASGFGDNYFDIDINAEIGSDYDVDQLVERIKTKITEDSMYRNVNAISFIR